MRGIRTNDHEIANKNRKTKGMEHSGSNAFALRVARFVLFAILLLPFIFYFLPFTLLASDWKQATGERIWSFPRDHGRHPEYRTEWWYFTGNLSDESGNRYGYQLTFFRHGIKKQPATGGSSVRDKNPWTVSDIYFAHFALTDKTMGRFWHTDRSSRTGPGLAGASTHNMDVRVLDWSAHMKKGTIYLNARHQGMKVELTLQPEKPPVLHGQDGLSRKGPADGQSSYYYSITDLKTCGSIKTPLSNKSVNVKGLSWFDQEFGSNQLTAEQVGWDWFGIHLSDGRDLMVYFLRKKDGTVEATSSGTIVEKNGSSGHLRLSDIHVDILDKWKSPKTGGIYPARWRIRIPSVHVDIIITPCIADQELATGFPAGIIYWEGAIEGKGTSEDKPVTVEGYVELTGYAGSIGGTF